MKPNVHLRKILKYTKEESVQPLQDTLIVEEPLEMRVFYKNILGVIQSETLNITMRTPSADEDLCKGFLLSEGIVSSVEEIGNIKYCQNTTEEAYGNVINIQLHAFPSEKETWRQPFMATSSCGICGRDQISSIEKSCSKISSNKLLSLEELFHSEDLMYQSQSAFKLTGGVHAVGIFTNSRYIVREDIGRHNALDKCIGAAVERKWDFKSSFVLLSSRISVEMVRKTIRMGIPILAAVGAPSELACQMAENMGLTLIGFLKKGKCNIYTHPQRVLEYSPLRDEFQ